MNTKLPTSLEAAIQIFDGKVTDANIKELQAIRDIADRTDFADVIEYLATYRGVLPEHLEQGAQLKIDEFADWLLNNGCANADWRKASRKLKQTRDFYPVTWGLFTSACETAWRMEKEVLYKLKK